MEVIVASETVQFDNSVLWFLGGYSCPINIILFFFLYVYPTGCYAGFGWPVFSFFSAVKNMSF